MRASGGTLDWMSQTAFFREASRYRKYLVKDFKVRRNTVMLCQRKPWQVCCSSLQQGAQRQDKEGTVPAEFMTHVDDLGFYLHSSLGR